MKGKPARRKRTLFQATVGSFLIAMGFILVSMVLFTSVFQSVVESSNHVLQRYIGMSTIRSELGEMMKLLAYPEGWNGVDSAQEQCQGYVSSIVSQLEALRQRDTDSDIYYRFSDLKKMALNFGAQADQLFGAVRQAYAQGYLDIEIAGLLRMRDTIVTEIADVLMEDVVLGEPFFRQRLKDYQALRVAFIAGMLALTAFCVTFIYKMTKRTVSPIRQLQEEIAKVSEGVPSPVEINTHGIAEMITLIDFFNRMAVQTQQYVEQMEANAQVEIKLKQEELKNLEYQHLLTESEYKFLQAQINPHFLYNTINSGMALASIEHAPRAKELLSNFAGYLRYNIGRHGEMVRLEEEMDVARAYIRIQNIRYEDRIDYDCELSPQAKELQVPYMIVLPLVENAILHGLAERDRHAMLLLNAVLTDQRLVITVADNGVGMTQDKLQSILEQPKASGTGNSIGIGNVMRRLELLYGGGCLSIQSRLGIGTKMTITIPMERMNQAAREEEAHA